MQPEERNSDGAPGAGEGTPGGLPEGASGVPGVAAPAGETPPEEAGDSGGETFDAAEDAPDSTGRGVEVGAENPAGAGAGAHQGGRVKPRISRQTFRAAVIAGNGSRADIARALGCTALTVSRRIAEDPELNALYGKAYGEPPAEGPSETQVMNRSSEDLPSRVAVEIGHIDDGDLAIYRQALRAYGVSEKRLAKLKALDGLAKDWATHLSISLRGHHQSYDGQLHNLAELADEIGEKLKETTDPEAYSYLAKIQVECVKEAGKGVNTMLTLTEALVRMMTADKNNQGAPQKATAGWGPMKRVRKPENSSAE